MTSSNNKSPWHYADLGLQFAIAIGLCLLGGFYLDKELSTSPLFLIIGVFLGGTAGFLNIYRAVYPGNRKKIKKSKDEKE